MATAAEKQYRPFSKAEFDRLVRLAAAANEAIADHRGFVEFLREQHEAPEDEGWLINNKGFELQVKNEPTPPAGTPPVAEKQPGDDAPNGEGVNGVVDEEVAALMQE